MGGGGRGVCHYVYTLVSGLLMSVLSVGHSVQSRVGVLM